MILTINATNRSTALQVLIEVRKALEGPYTTAHVWFDDGLRPCTYTREDLPAIYRKITYSM